MIYYPLRAVTGDISVLAHDRTGFAFEGGRIPGAYKADGTPKDGAVIIYITENNKNTVSLNITGASANPCIGLQNILYAIKKGKDTRPFIIRLIGNITDMTVMEGGDIVIENANNASSYITLEGIGSDAVANGWGIRLKAATNVEIRNIGSMNCNSTAGDDFGLQQDNDHIWLHNCDMFYGDAGSDADQIKGDGALDNKGSTYITFSYNHFWDNGKASLLGLSEGTTTGLYITYHHNWFDHSDSRHPRVRYYSAHVYNNYYDGNAKYGIGSTMGSSVFVENNFFRNCKYPMLTSMQGTDVFYGDGGTFSGEDGGSIKSFNNMMSGQTRYVTYNATTFPLEFDAIETATRDQVISNTILSKQGNNAYNNFDTDANLYVKNMIPDQPEVAKQKLMLYAGRVEGGDLKFTFNNAIDDASYLVNTAIKSALTNYKSALVSVQGENNSSTSTQTLTSTGNNSQTVNSGSAITPIVFTWGGDATDVTVSGLPVSGISFTKDINNKTVTISGTPTGNVSYSITTTGSTGSPVTVSGTITISSGGGTTAGDLIQNFTTSGKSSTFYTITGNLSTSYGNASYGGQTLTQCLKMESSTNISFTTTEPATLTLVFGSSYTGTIKIDGVTYSPSAGIISTNIAAGMHTIIKGSGSNYLFYMKVVYNSTGNWLQKLSDIVLYPNPARSSLNILSNEVIENIEIVNPAGILLKTLHGKQQTIDLNDLKKGIYFIRIYSGKDIIIRTIIKE
jgi:pectate lyase